jgi:hypothetical protein
LPFPGWLIHCESDRPTQIIPIAGLQSFLGLSTQFDSARRGKIMSKFCVLVQKLDASSVGFGQDSSGCSSLPLSIVRLSSKHRCVSFGSVIALQVSEAMHQEGRNERPGNVV